MRPAAGFVDRISPRQAIAAVVALSTVVWGVLAYEASIPHFFMDELFYMKAGVSFVEGHGLGYHGQSWGYGPVFPLVVAAVTWVTPDQEVTYVVVKLLNALAFSLTAVPVYLIARRLLSPWTCVAVAAAAVAIPSSAYVSVVMTESIAYMIALWALLAVVRALEEPTPLRQLVAIGASGAAVATRPQIVAIYVAYVAGLVAVVFLSVPVRRQARERPLTFWPTALSLVVGAGWLLRPLLEGRSFSSSFGAYGVLAQSYDVPAVAKWFVYHLGDVTLYLAVVPVVVAPVVLLECWRRHRAGSASDLGFLVLFLAQNAIGIGLVAAFASTPYGLGLLYDRYLFYLVPLWLLVFARWLEGGMLRPTVPLALGASVAVVSIAALPFGVVATDDWFSQFEAVATEVWGKVGQVSSRLPVDSPRGLGIAFALVLAVAVAVVPRRRAWILVTAVALVIAADVALAWRSAFVSAADFGVVPGRSRSWVDRRVGANAHVTVLYVSRSCRRHPERTSEWLTDFFNRSVDVSEELGGERGRPVGDLRIRPDGTLVFRSGKLFTAPYLVTQPGVELRGTRLDEGMATRLVLWDIHGPVSVVGARSESELWQTRCAT